MLWGDAMRGIRIVREVGDATICQQGGVAITRIPGVECVSQAHTRGTGGMPASSSLVSPEHAAAARP